MHPVVSEQVARMMMEDRLHAAAQRRLARAAREARPPRGVRQWAGIRLIGLGRRLAGTAGATT